MPWLLVRYLFKTEQTKTLPYKTYSGYLWASALTWWAAVIMPNVPVSDQTDSTSMHFLGGVVAALLFIYTIKVYKFRFVESWQTWVALYLFVSGLGVLNELFELFLDSTIIDLPLTETDTWWDLLANTAGAFTAYAVISFYQRLKNENSKIKNP